jgi:deoxycytidine triphosphate deaminase
MTVDTDKGIFIEENSRVAQLIIFENEDTEGYNGQWQGGQKVSKLVRG